MSKFSTAKWTKKIKEEFLSGITTGTVDYSSYYDETTGEDPEITSLKAEITSLNGTVDKLTAVLKMIGSGEDKLFIKDAIGEL